MSDRPAHEDSARRVRELEDEVQVSRAKLLEASGERDNLQQYLDIASGIILVIDADRRVRFINRHGCQILGCDEQQVIGQDWFETFLPPEKREQVTAVFQALVQGESGPVEYHENHVLTRQGERRLIAWHNTVLEEEADRVTATMSSGYDITESERIKADLRQKERMLRGVFDQTFGFIGLMTLDGTLIDVNRTALEAAGLDQSEVLNRPFWEGAWWAHSAEQQQQLREAVARAAQGEVVHIQAHHLDPEGNDYYIDGSIKPILDDDGNVAYLLPEGHDVTDRKRAEEILREAHDALEARVNERTAELTETNVLLTQEIAERQEASRQLEEYHEKLRSLASELSLTEERERRRIANVVHDHIGQDLAFAKMKLGVLRDSGGGDRSGDIDEIVQTIDRTLKDTRSLVSDLGSQTLYQLGLVPAVESLCERSRAQYGLTVNFQDDGQPKEMSEDLQVLLFQALRELLANVARHAEATTCSVALEMKGDHLRATVVDDGKGFEPGAVGPGAGQDAGFGFFSIQERLEPLDGRLEIHSSPGQGTRITLIAPCVRRV